MSAAPAAGGGLIPYALTISGLLCQRKAPGRDGRGRVALMPEIDNKTTTLPRCVNKCARPPGKHVS